MVRTTTNPTTFAYDGFGNLTSKTLAGTTTSIATDATTNRLSSATCDTNGNMTAGSGATLTYDVANRVTSSQTTAGGSLKEYYGYGADNKRMWRIKTNGTEEWTFYGAHGEKIGDYQLGSLQEHFNQFGSWTYDTRAFTTLRESVWFDGKLILENGAPVLQDRLGTNRVSSARYYPYGEEITSTSNDKTKFGTYTRDGFTGLDYADQRYFASTYGRFNTADPYMRGAVNLPQPEGFALEPSDSVNRLADFIPQLRAVETLLELDQDLGTPASLLSAELPHSPEPRDALTWNEYSYVTGDPINLNDPRGLAKKKNSEAKENLCFYGGAVTAYAGVVAIFAGPVGEAIGIAATIAGILLTPFCL